MGNDNGCRAGIERSGQANLIMLWYPHNDSGRAFGVMVGSLNSAGTEICIQSMSIGGKQLSLLVKGQTIEHAMLDVDPDEVGLCRSKNLDTVSTT
jgi:hypothetical protein